MKKYKKLADADYYYFIFPKKIGTPSKDARSYRIPIQREHMANLLKRAIKMTEDICAE